MDTKIEFEIDQESFDEAKKKILSLRNLEAEVFEDAKYEGVREKLLELENRIWFLVTATIIILASSIMTIIYLFGR